ncbi:MAG TPA: hypothetical protein VHB21_19785, partial [Minicystis sp.]|nr:hypothetical protein [Minicystis sp.]
VCSRHPSWCSVASRTYAARGGDDAATLGMLATACRAYDASSCDALGAAVHRMDLDGARLEPCCVSALVATCEGGVAASCGWVSLHAHARRDDGTEVPSGVSDLACRGGELTSCAAAPGALAAF